MIRIMAAGTLNFQDSFACEQGATFAQTLTYSNFRRPESAEYTDGVMTAASAVLTSATAAFTAADVGRSITVSGAAANNGDLTTTISSVASATSATLAVAATIAVSAANFHLFAPVDLTGQTARMSVRTAIAEGSMTAASAVLTTSKPAFTAADVGRSITVFGVAASGGDLTTTIASVASATSATLTVAATITVSAAKFDISILSLTTENGGLTLGGTAGTIAIAITATATAAVAAARYVYDLEIISGSTVTRLVQGAFFIAREVTR